jgi:hypothetical protein
MDADADRPVGTSGTIAERSDKQPIELSGCLEKSNNSYIVTETSRRAANGATRTYRLQAAGHDSKLASLVGKQVRVSGILLDRADPLQDDERRANDLVVGTSGRRDNDHAFAPARVASGEPGRIDVRSILPVAERCGAK